MSLNQKEVLMDGIVREILGSASSHIESAETDVSALPIMPSRDMARNSAKVVVMCKSMDKAWCYRGRRPYSPAGVVTNLPLQRHCSPTSQPTNYQPTNRPKGQPNTEVVN